MLNLQVRFSDFYNLTCLFCLFIYFYFFKQKRILNYSDAYSFFYTICKIVTKNSYRLNCIQWNKQKLKKEKRINFQVFISIKFSRIRLILVLFFTVFIVFIPQFNISKVSRCFKVSTYTFAGFANGGGNWTNSVRQFKRNCEAFWISVRTWYCDGLLTSISIQKNTLNSRTIWMSSSTWSILLRSEGDDGILNRTPIVFTLIHSLVALKYETVDR